MKHGTDQAWLLEHEQYAGTSAVGHEMKDVTVVAWTEKAALAYLAVHPSATITEVSINRLHKVKVETPAPRLVPVETPELR